MLQYMNIRTPLWKRNSTGCYQKLNYVPPFSLGNRRLGYKIIRMHVCDMNLPFLVVAVVLWRNFIFLLPLFARDTRNTVQKVGLVRWEGLVPFFVANFAMEIYDSRSHYLHKPSYLLYRAVQTTVVSHALCYQNWINGHIRKCMWRRPMSRMLQWENVCFLFEMEDTHTCTHMRR